MVTNLDMLVAWCGALPIAGGTVLALFLAGALGAPMHCGAMCGGFVLGQVADRMTAMPVARLCEWRRIGAATLLPYHLGRLTTYAALGAAAGFGAAALLPQWTRAVLLLLGAMLFLLRGLRGLSPIVGRFIPVVEFVPAAWRRAVARFTRMSGQNGYWLGVALGFLPCGFLYAALAVAASTLHPVTGAAAMLAFGLGTVPTLVAIGVAGHSAGRRWQHSVMRFSPALMLLNAALLAVLAVRSI